MERDLYSEASIIINDLHNIAIRIEMLQAHPEYTTAGEFVRSALASMEGGRHGTHQAAMKARHD